jgi:hypothetical protein
MSRETWWSTGPKVTYSHGWRRGSQVTGPIVVLEFGTESVRQHVDEE